MSFGENGESEKYLKIIEVDTNKEFAKVEIEKFDKVQFNWIHSVENTPWQEDFIINKKYFLELKKVSFKEFGAGMPFFEKEKMKDKDGYIVITDLNREYSSYNWINSKTATSDILVNGEKILNGKDLPHHSSMEMIIKEGK